MANKSELLQDSPKNCPFPIVTDRETHHDRDGKLVDGICNKVVYLNPATKESWTETGVEFDDI